MYFLIPFPDFLFESSKSFGNGRIASKLEKKNAENNNAVKDGKSEEPLYRMFYHLYQFSQ